MRLLEFHLEVEDLERSLSFYTALLEPVKVVRWDHGAAAALVMADGGALGLWIKGHKTKFDGRAGAHVHFAFQVGLEELFNYHERLRSLGVEVIEHDWANGHKSLYFFDRDGHLGELMTCDWLAL